MNIPSIELAPSPASATVGLTSAQSASGRAKFGPNPVPGRAPRHGHRRRCRHQALSMLTNDFVTMTRAADRARPSPYPNTWRVRNLALAAASRGTFRLVYLVAIPGLGWYWLRLSPGQMQTLTFTALAFAGQGNVYVLRERGRLWHSRPAPIMLLASCCDVALVASFAVGGILMDPLPKRSSHHFLRPRWYSLWRWTPSS